MTDKRYRIQHRFWLDGTKPREDDLSIRLDELRQNREFASFMRDAITLLFSLKDGDLSVFAEMFPDAITVIKQEGADEERRRYQAEHNGKLAQLNAMIASINTLKSAQPSGPKQLGTGNGSLPGGPKQLSAPMLAAPNFDDDEDDVLTVKRDTSTQSAANFIEAALRLQQ